MYNKIMEKKLNIAMFSDSFYPIVGGRENVIDNLMRGLKPHANAFLLTSTFKGQKKFIEDSALPYEVIRTKSLRLTKNEYLCLINRKTKKLIEQKIKNGEIDIIHTQTKYALAKYALKLGKKYNIPVVTTCHTNYSLQYKNQLKYPIIYNLFLNHVKKIINKMDGVITVSNYMKLELNKLGIVKPITVIPNGTDLIQYCDLSFNKVEIKSKYNLNNSDYIFIFVGRITPLKNINLIFDTLQILKNKKINYKMLFIGGGDIEKYKQLSIEKNLEEMVVFTGPITNREEISKLYSISDLNLFPSIIETFGLTIQESGVLSTPSVTIKNSVTSENIIHNKNGFISNNTAEDFANTILSAIADKENLKQIGINAKQTFNTSWNEIAIKHIEEYKKILKNKKQS